MPVNGLVSEIDVPADKDSGKYKIHYARYEEGSKRGIKEDAEFDLVIGSDGANSRVAKVRSRPIDTMYSSGSCAPVRRSTNLSLQPTCFLRGTSSCLGRYFPICDGSLTPTLPLPRCSVCLQAMDAGEYNYAIAFQERIKISEEKMEFYEVCVPGGRAAVLQIDQGARSLRSTHVS